MLDRVADAVEKACPERPVDLTLGVSAELLPAVERRDLDLALVGLPARRRDLNTFPVASVQLSVAMRRDDPLATTGRLHVEDINDRIVVMLSSDAAPASLDRLRSELVAAGLHNLRQLDHRDTAKTATHVRREHTLAVTISPRFGGLAALYDDPQLVVIPLVDGPRQMFGLAWRSDREAEPALQGILGALRNEWADGPTDLSESSLTTEE
ncbi:LysR family transcriptional regulator substrate-binding protein [Pseudonocardia sp.]|uniref:LysR family transcriptional regulator substrate-binding protein n=1 Tax=Pseudonocardia sp. TaxID=60912 RepID=UPI002631FDC6|nr:LysR family transcriptional regulator substrate-binding protein [Pseudonocardia sp.]MCW2717962.1 transcriptional regulator, LysR family [Pseudonocardia sp.]